jgi:hypothetical protein
MRPKPRIRNAIEETANTTKFLKRMFTVFFARQKPDSTRAKPRFMKKTRNAAIITQRVSMAIFWLAMASAISFVKAGAASPAAAAPSAARAGRAATAARISAASPVIRVIRVVSCLPMPLLLLSFARHPVVASRRARHGKLMSICSVTVFCPPVRSSL